MRALFFALLACSISLSVGQSTFFSQIPSVSAPLLDFESADDHFHIFVSVPPGYRHHAKVTPGGELLSLSLSGLGEWAINYVEGAYPEPDRIMSQRKEYFPTGLYDEYLFRLTPAGDTLWKTLMTYSDYVFNRTAVPVSGGRFLTSQISAPEISPSFPDWTLHLTMLDDMGLPLDTFSTFIGNGFDNHTLLEIAPDRYLCALNQRYNIDKGSMLWYILDENLDVLHHDSIPFVDHIGIGKAMPYPDGSGILLYGTFSEYLTLHDGIRLAKTDLDGNLLWEKMHIIPGKSAWIDAEFDINSNIHVLGSAMTNSTLGLAPNLIYKFDNAGDSLDVWEFLPGPGYAPRALEYTNDHHFMIFGNKADTCYPGPLPGWWNCSGGSIYMLKVDSTGHIDHAVLSGEVYNDLNGNLIRDPGEQGMADRIVETDDGSHQAITNGQGEFELRAYKPDTFDIRTGIPSYFEIADPLPDPTHPVEIPSLPLTIGGLDFVFEDSVPVQDLISTAYCNIVRSMEDFKFTITVKNNGTYNLDSVNVFMAYTDSIIFQNSIPAEIDHSPYLLQWRLYNLKIGESRNIQIVFHYPHIIDNPATTPWFGLWSSWLEQTVWAEGPNTEITPADNEFSLILPLGSSYDPNDKLVNPAGQGEDHNIDPETEWLTYTVRFQNTGNDTAFLVRVFDDLPEELDILSFEMLGSSHQYSISIPETDQLCWTFENILLPDSATDQLGSNGFFTFRIRTKEDLPLGTRIENFVDIYFDYNQPVRTEKAFVTLADPQVLNVEHPLGQFAVEFLSEPC